MTKAPKPPAKGVASARVVRVDGDTIEAHDDELVVEEPLEVRIDGDTFATTMRTPGHDRELALGLLFSEGVLGSVRDVGHARHCRRTGDEGRENVLDVGAAPGKKLNVPDEIGGRRGTLVTSACGVCGRRTVDDLVTRCGLVEGGGAVPRDAVPRAVRSLSEGQPVFRRTGGCHAAALVTFAGEVVATFEDVGRHNAVDKVVGAMLLRDALPLAGHVLAVSGRAGFEIVQKAALAGIPVVASVSAPSSLAVDLARRTNVTLAGFVRGERYNVYAGEARLEPTRGATSARAARRRS